ncbi:MAG TPA: glycogen/starch/alpha-glucan phosphorylase [Pirellulales bacterium]
MPPAARSITFALPRRLFQTGYSRKTDRSQRVNRARTIDADPAVQGRMKVVFLPAYRVTLAERLIPASDVSGKFSSDRTIAEYASNIWNVEPCPVP